MQQLQSNIRLGRGVRFGNAPLPPLQPYTRCPCGACPECRSNAKWDRVFQKFAVKEYGDTRGVFGSPLNDL